MKTIFKPLNRQRPHIRILLHRVFLDTRCKLEFVALSYVWGDPKLTRSIIVDGVSVTVTQNLYDALVWHRDNTSWLPKNDLPIWADAICINQADLDEKTHQIKLMKRIYQQATHVLCWLGPTSTPRMDLYLHWLQDLAPGWNQPPNTKISEGTRNAHWHPSRPTTTEEWQEIDVLTALQVFNGETEFHRLQYFRRMWTFQEALLPKMQRTFFVLGGVIRKYSLCESFKIELPRFIWSKVRKLINLEHTRPQVLSDYDRRTLQEIRDPVFLDQTFARRSVMNGAAISMTKRLGTTNFGLGEPMVATAARQCGNLHDKIFALYGLLFEDHDLRDNGAVRTRVQALEVDYKKPLNKVILDALRYIHHSEGTHKFLLLEVLREFHSRGPRRSASIQARDKYPSWLPELRGYRMRSYARDSDFTSPYWLCGSGRVSWRIDYLQNRSRDVLHFNGKRVGTVCMVLPFPRAARDIVAQVIEILKHARTEEHKRPQHPGPTQPSTTPSNLSRPVNLQYVAPRRLVASIANKCKLERRLAQSLRRHATSDLQGRISDVEYWPRLQAILQNQTASHGTQTARDALYLNEKSASYLRSRALVVLDNGIFALCMAKVHVGDVVFASAAWRGGILLRPAWDVGEKWHRLLTTVVHLDDQIVAEYSGVSRQDLEYINLI
ncbi:heterokaryon incompatibility protein-domain-containing protein [Microdochium trichocladiopsis]|uniref:Heterokaryon incompatibility protein-domain-containing protein n=1 Tax=Microdochium trichocladiopsis TaxID=1682393 RepID=A0A9P9BIC1_9PEZI|nr:heterokaryon incompatibility protein-domain-containing protein [Microdochium trichocladiopsis]KAH7014253.1 heterokaryon incompatibility protein-domain-containing protein [Microdochium trichocladiopsis]